jgi:hypothetical protein
MRPSGRSRIEQIGQVAFVFMCLAVGAAGIRFVIGGRIPGPPLNRPSPIAAGTRLASASRFNPSGTSATLVLVLSTQCRFCTESLPFYDRLSKLDAVRAGRLHIGIASFEQADRMRSYLVAHGVELSSIVPLTQTSLRVAVTPTVLLLDKAGFVVNVWEGKLEPQAEDDLVSKARKLVGS